MAPPRSLGANLTPQPDARIWTCALNAFAVASGLQYSVIQATVGHDGSEVVDASLNSSERYRGFTDAELVRALWLAGYPVVTINFEDLPPDKKLVWRGLAFPHNYVVYYVTESGLLHAIACQGTKCVDIRGKVTDVRDIDVNSIHSIYIVIKGMECRDAVKRD